MSELKATEEFKYMRELPIELQYYFLQGLPADQQLFAALACREWYDMMAGRIHVSVEKLICQDDRENFLIVLPKVLSLEPQTVWALTIACEQNKVNIITMMWLQGVCITCLKNAYTSTCDGKTHIICPLHVAATYCVKNNNVDMLRMLGDICPHIFESDGCVWMPDEPIQPMELMMIAVLSQSASIILYLLTTPLANRYNIERIAEFAKHHGKNVSSMCIEHYLAAATLAKSRIQGDPTVLDIVQE